MDDHTEAARAYYAEQHLDPENRADAPKLALLLRLTHERGKEYGRQAGLRRAAELLNIAAADGRYPPMVRAFATSTAKVILKRIQTP